MVNFIDVRTERYDNHPNTYTIYVVAEKDLEAAIEYLKEIGKKVLGESCYLSGYCEIETVDPEKYIEFE